MDERKIRKTTFPLVDGHCDSIAGHVAGEWDLTVGGGRLSLPMLRQAGVAVQFFACFVKEDGKPESLILRGLELVEGCRRLIAENPADLCLLETAARLDEVLDTGKTAILLSVEGGKILGGKLFMLSLLYRLGVRSLILTWNYANDLAGGVREPGGLTTFGRDVVREMDRLGMLVDVSHLSDPAFWDVLDVSVRSVIASHSCCRSLYDHPRNLTDGQIKALAEQGGVIGINFYTEFLTGGKAALEDVVRHVDHVCSLVGPDFVGLGSDFDGCESLPVGLENAGCLPALMQALLDRGYSEENTAKIAGGNFLRVIRQVLAD